MKSMKAQKTEKTEKDSKLIPTPTPTYHPPISYMTSIPIAKQAKSTPTPTATRIRTSDDIGALLDTFAHTHASAARGERGTDTDEMMITCPSRITHPVYLQVRACGNI